MHRDHPLRRATTGMVQVAGASTSAHADLRSRIIGIGLLTLALDLAAAGIGLLVDHFPDYGRALFWTTTQLLTVSSQEPYPSTDEGRVLDVFLQLWAITAVTALAGSFGAFFHHRSMDRRAAAGD